MARLQATYRDRRTGDVRVVPVELCDWYERRGWERVEDNTPEPAPQPETDPRPAKTAKVDEWRAYAINHAGVPSYEAAELNRDELIKRVG